MAELFVTTAKPTQTITGVTTADKLWQQPTILPPKPVVNGFKYADSPEVWDSSGHHYTSWDEFLKAGGSADRITTVPRTSVPALPTPVAPASTPVSMLTPKPQPMVFPVTNPAALTPKPYVSPLPPLQPDNSLSTFKNVEPQNTQGNTSLLMNKTGPEEVKQMVRAPIRAGLSVLSSAVGNEDPIQATTKAQRFLVGDEPVTPIARSTADLELALQAKGFGKASLPAALAFTVLSTTADLYPGAGGEDKLIREASGLLSEQLLKGVAKDEALNAVYSKFGVKIGQQIEKEVLPKITEQVAKGDGSLLAKTISEQGREIHTPITPETVNKFTEPVKPPVEPKLALPTLTKKDSLLTKLKNVLKPIEGTDQATQDIYRTWANSQVTGKELANQEAKNLAEVPAKAGWETILKYEKGEATPYTAKIQETFDKLHTEAINKGLDVPYRENYVPQMYKNSPEEVTAAVAKFMQDKGVSTETINRYINGKDLPEEVSKALKLNPSFTKQRVLPDYETAMKYGLDPKFTHPGQLASAYRQSLEDAVANKKFVTDLMSQGKVVSSRVAPKGWEPINLSFAPKGLAAEPKLAKALNGLYRDEMNLTFGQTLAKNAAKASKFMQELALSAGFPGTDVNFFSMGQLIKEVTSGKVSAIPAFIRANFDSATIRFFEEKAPIIQKMAENGIDITDRVGNFRDAYKNMVAKKSFGEALGHGWDTAFQKKTFASFMPQLYTNTFEGAYKGALKKGLTEEAASKLAADVTRNYHGLMENVARSKGTEDALSSLFFAPKFREGIINTLLNTGKSLTTELRNPAFNSNRRLAVGMALTYGAYQYANKQLNGNYTWENEPGHEFDLKIPLPDGKGVLYVPFMPSFLSLPRNIGSAGIALYKGDLKTATQKGSSTLSMPIQITSQILNNSDYFGNPIYKDTDTRVERLKKIGNYLGLQANHPYLKLIGNYIANKQEPDKAFQKPLIQSILEASEFPVKFDTLDRISRSQFYTAADKKTAENATATKKVQPIFDRVQDLKDAGKVDEAQSIVDGLSEEDYATYKKIKATGTRKNTSNTEAKLFQTYQQVQKLKDGGNLDAAQKIVDSLSDDEYHAYTLLKNRFNPDN